MELKDSVRVMTKEEFESAINEDIKFVEGIKHFFKHDDATRVMEHVKSVLEASVDYTTRIILNLKQNLETWERFLMDTILSMNCIGTACCITPPSLIY